MVFIEYVILFYNILIHHVFSNGGLKYNYVLVMKEYICNRCMKVFNHKSTYDRHTSRKTPCKLVGNYCEVCNKMFSNKSNLIKHKKTVCNKKDNKQDKFVCIYCNNEFTRASSLKRHMELHCKAKDKIEKEKETIYKELVQKKKEVEDLNKKLGLINNSIETNNNSHNIISHNNFQNTITSNSHNTFNMNNIKLVAFGKEDLEYIPKKKAIGLIKTGFQSVPNTADYVHFSEDNPSLHNVYIPNKKDPYAMIYDGKDWKLVLLDNVLSQLYGDTRDYLEQKYKTFYNALDEHAKRKFGKFLQFADDEEQMEIIKERLKLLIYNKKDIPINTKKKTREQRLLE